MPGHTQGGGPHPRQHDRHPRSPPLQPQHGEHNLSPSLQYGTLRFQGPSDVYIAYLPLAHVLEVLGEMMCTVWGVSIGYSHANTLTDK